jgi:LL-diaminopimelate aminotransferase
MTTKLQPARRILDLPPYLFKEIDDKKRALTAQGKTLLNLGIGDPDLPTPEFIVAAMAREMGKNENQKYPAYDGCAPFRQAVAAYMKKRFAVDLDPNREVMALIGSKEGLAHFSWTYIDAGDVALVPDPAYPVYKTTTIFAGGEVFTLPLREQNNFFPDVSEVPEAVLARAKVLYLNYPNNPTGAVPTREQLTSVIAWAKKHSIIIVSDAAYAELVYDPKNRLSLLSLPGGRDVVLEFHSFSKTFNMTGWRIGFAVGNADLISGLLKMKTNVDSGAFEAIQLACVDGLQKIDTFMDALINTYRARRDTLVNILKKHTWEVTPSEGAFYVWAKCPQGVKSKAWTMELLEKTGIVTTPGSGFGQYGEGYIRFALTQPVEVIQTLDERLKNIGTKS